MSTHSPWKSAFAPATVANLGPGFDVLGLALDEGLGLGDTCDVRLEPGNEIHIEVSGDNGRLPTDPALNVASVAAARVLALAGAQTGLGIRLHKGLPLGSGLGSSAASAASASLATNEALGHPLTRMQLVEAGRAGEAVAAGFPHPDNVAPALLGGFLLMVDDVERGLQIVRLPVPKTLCVAVVIPELEVCTADARAALPERVPMQDAVENMGRIGLLISALYDGDFSRLAMGTKDRLHQPYRASLVPGFDSGCAAALAAGAVSVGLSGSGPAMFALADGEDAAHACGEALANAFRSLEIKAYYKAGKIGRST